MSPRGRLLPPPQAPKKQHLNLNLLRRFAFVEFETVKDATDALESLNNTDIEGRSIRLEFSQNSGRGDGGRGSSGRCCWPRPLHNAAVGTRYDEILSSRNLREDSER